MTIVFRSFQLTTLLITRVIFSILFIISAGSCTNVNEEISIENTMSIQGIIDKKENSDVSNTQQLTEQNLTYKFKTMACNDAACSCNECYYEFIASDGSKLIVHEVDEKAVKIKLYETIEHYEEGGWVEVVPNKQYVNKNFYLTYSSSSCKCPDGPTNENYIKLISLKLAD